MDTTTQTAEPPPSPARVEHILIEPGFCGGKPHIAGHRIKVQHVAVWHERLGMSPDEIASGYGLTLGQVYAALAYYWDHKAQIDADIAEAERLADQLRAGAPSIFDKVKQRNASGDSLPPG
jgi:uncharacterized protein (DUF433 family)